MSVITGSWGHTLRLAALAGASAGLLAMTAGCGGEPVTSAPIGQVGQAGAAGAARQPAARTAAPQDPALDACVERSVRGPGYDDLAPRDARRKLKRLQVRADCLAQLGR